MIRGSAEVHQAQGIHINSSFKRAVFINGQCDTISDFSDSISFYQLCKTHCYTVIHTWDLPVTFLLQSSSGILIFKVKLPGIRFLSLVVILAWLWYNLLLALCFCSSVHRTQTISVPFELFSQRNPVFQEGVIKGLTHKDSSP